MKIERYSPQISKDMISHPNMVSPQNGKCRRIIIVYSRFVDFGRHAPCSGYIIASYTFRYSKTKNTEPAVAKK